MKIYPRIPERHCSKLRLVLCVFFVVIFFTRVGANVAPPGFWGAGHGSTLIPVFQEDSTAIKQIQMVKEWIEIDLYRNYAVVKGTYWFKNHSNQNLKLRMGYPVNGSNAALPVEEVRFDDLYHLKALINGKSVQIKPLSELINSDSLQNDGPQLIPTALNDWEDWYVWQLESLPNETVKVEVYFIVKTSTTLIQGYGRKKGNAFEYILHTGASWKSKIVSGSVEVQLKDGLSVRDISGVNPRAGVTWADNWLMYSFSNLEPNNEDDLIIWYEGDPEDFTGDFLSDSLFQALDSRIAPKLESDEWQVLDKADFDTPLPEFVYVIVGIIVIFLLVLTGIIWAVIWIIKKVRK